MIVNELYSEIECHSEGLDIRLFLYSNDKFGSTVMVLSFDLFCRLTENTWISDEDSIYLNRIKDSLIERECLDPHYLESFIDKWNDYKKGINEYLERPVFENIIVLDVQGTLKKFGIEEEYKQIPLPEFGQAREGNRAYMFEYRNNDIDSESIDGAFERFIDDVLGNQYMKFLKNNELPTENLGEIEVLQEKFEICYNKVIQHLENGAYLSFEVWSKEDGLFEGYACEIEREEAILG